MLVLACEDERGKKEEEGCNHTWARGRPSGGGSGNFFLGGEWFFGPLGGEKDLT